MGTSPSSARGSLLGLGWVANSSQKYGTSVHLINFCVLLSIFHCRGRIRHFKNTFNSEDQNQFQLMTAVRCMQCYCGELKSILMFECVYFFTLFFKLSQKCKCQKCKCIFSLYLDFFFFLTYSNMFMMVFFLQ